MSTIEKALIQIFERKNRIIDHVKHQILLFDHQLASKCLIDGFVPPHWLISSAPSQLDKENLISGLLLPHPQASFPYCSLYQQPVVTTDNVLLPHILCSRVDASNDGLDQCLSGKAYELDPSVTSPPQDCRDGLTSDICPDLCSSLARIQRSKSRQRALEHRNSAKACKNNESCEKNDNSCNNQNKASKVASLQSGIVNKLELTRSSDILPTYELEKEERGKCSSKGKSENVYPGRVTRMRSSIHPSKYESGPLGTGNNSFVAKKNNVVSYEVEKGKRVDCRRKERNEKVVSGRVTRSRSSAQPSMSMSGLSGAGNTSTVAKQDGPVPTESICKSRQQLDVHELLESKFVRPVCNTVYCGVKIEERGQCRSKARSEDVFTRSRSSVQSPKFENSSTGAEKSFFVAKQDGIVLTESINKSGLEHDASEERGQCRSKARGDDVYSGRITRSRSSVQPAKSENSPPGVGKSSTVAKQDGIVLTESIKKSGLEHAVVVELLQSVKPVDDDVTCMVENEERGRFQSKERDESFHSGSVTRAGHSVQPPNFMNGISCAGKTCDVAQYYGSVEPIRKSKEQNNVVDELLELVKSPAICAGCCGSKKEKDLKSKEKENNVCQGRLKRSRSSSQQKDYENKHLKLDSCPERSTDDGICKSMQVACHTLDHKELIKPCDITDESCGREARASDNQTKLGTAVDQYNDDSTNSRANCGANMFELVGSSNGLESEVKMPKPKDSNKLPHATSPDSSKRIEFKEVSGSQVNSLPCANDSSLAGLNQCDAIVADTYADSDELVEAHLAGSAVNLDGVNNPLLAKSLNMYNRVDLEVVRTSQHSESAMMVLPKQLDFDDLGECTLSGASSLILETEKVGNSLEKRSITPLPCAGKLDEATSVLNQNKYNSSLEQLLKYEDFRKRERGSETDLNKTLGPGRTSKLNVVSSIKETAEASSDDITSILPESNEISGWKTFTEDLSTTFKVCNENLLGNSLNDVAPSNLNANKETDYLFKDYGKLEEEKSVMSAQKASNPNTGVCSCPANLADIDFTGVCNPSLLMKADVTSSDASEHPCVAPFEETKGHPLKQNVEPSPSQNQDADSLGRCIADDIDSVLDHIHAKSSENKVTVQSIQPGRHPGMHVESSWPHKRQKVEDQLSNSPSLSLSMKGKCDWQENGGNENTPSTFMHEQFDVASISSLPQQNLENNEDHLEEGTRGVYPSSIMFSGDVNLEHFICDGRSKQKRKSQLGEDGEFATSLINSPCQPHAGLLSSDQSRPEVEGFITDSEHVCIGGDGISFPNLDLPKTTIECAGVLEQLCKSACIHTPLSQFPTTYGVHRTTDLYQSVPNGLLECMGQKSTLPNNDVLRSQLKVSTSCFDDATNNAFLGRSFSDCLLYSGSQVTEDGKKLHLSPMLWDKITSYSGSSEKRRSLNPDLPCISEENENTDEVVDRFQEDAAFEVVASSVKREPLADIKECPNVAAVVSGAEQFTFRDSLDSVNTAYTFTGTENGIKQKVEKHNASKRRDTSKLKKNRNMLPGANDTKRASESLRNRSSKLQLSDETSLRKGGPSFSQKEPKVNNIVSNITSFIPIVQQKQAASTITGKRDVKVKALEAAEAAKKLAEKKENDRKMKKEALKLERARLEQENMRQLELEKKKKEEERKKKVADMAAKKRQREEEEKLEKERKRKHMEDARRQQRALEEKLRSKKDENEKESQAPDERGQTMKVPSDEAAKHKKVQKEIAGGNGRKVSEMELRTAVASTSVKPCTIIEDNTKVMSTLDRARESDNPIADIGQEQSYDISPYKGSDDEDDDDDEPNNKFIPSWASKKRVALVVTSQQQLDPEGIFPPGSFCSISEVLLPRKLQQNRAS